jgi:hypothetical protein
MSQVYADADLPALHGRETSLRFPSRSWATQPGSRRDPGSVLLSKEACSRSTGPCRRCRRGSGR